MEILEYLRRQFTYDFWANAEVLAALKAAEPSAHLVRPLQLLSHIASAERLWLERIRQQPQSLPVWPEFTLIQCEAQLAGLSKEWGDYLSHLSVDSLSQPIAYTNSKAESWTNGVQDILAHVILHSAYHRGQIAILVRTAGLTPACTDFIHPIRKGLIE